MEKETLRNKEAKKITLIGFWVNTLLTVFKIYAGILGGSGAMIADSIHSLSDFLTDMVVLLGFKFSEKPEDDCHNYGHGKYETLATAVIGVLLFFVGFEIIKSGIRNIGAFIKGESLAVPGIIALVAALLSILSKEILYHYTIIVGNKIKSPSIIANAWHHRSDAFSSIGTLLGIGGAIILGRRGAILDPIASIIVGLFIFKIAYRILTPAINELMEASLNKEDKSKIKEVIGSNKEVKDFHHLRARKIGSGTAIEFHILVNDNLNIKDAHQVCDALEGQLRSSFGESSIITIHVEPFNS